MQSARDVVAWLSTQGYAISNVSDTGDETGRVFTVDAAKPYVEFKIKFISTKTANGRDEHFVTVATAEYAPQVTYPTWQAVFEYVRREIGRYDTFHDMAPTLNHFLVGLGLTVNSLTYAQNGCVAAVNDQAGQYCEINVGMTGDGYSLKVSSASSPTSIKTHKWVDNIPFDNTTLYTNILGQLTKQGVRVTIAGIACRVELETLERFLDAVVGAGRPARADALRNAIGEASL